MLEPIIFGTFSGLLLFSAVMVVFSSQAIQSALWLMLSFFSAAALWVLLNAEFLGLLLILVYVGAVLTLFLFVIMTLSTAPTPALSKWQYLKHYGLPCSIVLTGLGCLLYGLYDQLGRTPSHQLVPNVVYPLIQKGNNTQTLGVELYTHYIYPFELVGILLLVAIVVSISLHADSQDQAKKTTLFSQKKIETKRSKRIKLVQGD